MSVYAETRYGRFTGRWISEIKNHPKLGRVREPFATEKIADAFDAHVQAHGTYPDWFVKGQREPGHTWNAALSALEEAGGPDGRWRSPLWACTARSSYRWRSYGRTGSLALCWSRS